MSSAALKLASAVSVTGHAIERRLAFERATDEQISWILESNRCVAEDVIRQEIDAAIELVPDARRIFMHPGREAVIGQIKPRVYFDRNGRRKQSSGFRTNDSRYYWSGDVIYVVDHQTVVTCILPDERQVMTLFSVMPQAEEIGTRMTSILIKVDQSFSCPAVNSPRSGIIPFPSATYRRETPQVAEWLRDPEAAWTVIVAGDDGEASDLEDRAVLEIWREAKKGGAIYIENVADKAIEQIMGRLKDFGSIKAQPLPDLPEVDWANVNGKTPSSMKEWWHEMVEAGEPAGRLVTVMTPKSARSLLETASGSSDAGWRIDSECCSSGRKLNLLFYDGFVLVGRDKY